MNLLAIDQGTSSTKAMVISEDGAILASASVAVEPTPLGDDGMEQDPDALLASIVAAGTEALERCGTQVEAVGIANQGETVVAWDPVTSAALGPAIVWQDRRAAVVTEERRDHAARLFSLTGLPLDPYFTGPKLRWLADRAPAGARVGGIDAWLNLQLTGSAMTDVATASRSALLDLDARTWSPEAAEIFGIEVGGLPELVDCAGALGSTTAFGPDLAITGLCVDQQAALIGEGCLAAGEAKCTYGTGAFLLASTGADPTRSAHGLSTSVAFQVAGGHGYCLDGQVYTAGSAIDWLLRLGLLSSPAALDDLVSTADPDATPVCVPAFAGLGAPHWEPRGKAVLESMTLATGAAEIAAAVVEGLAAQVALLATAAAADLGTPLTVLRVDGGLTGSTALMQRQADLLQIPLEVFSSPHATALGIAALACLGAGGSSELRPLPIVAGRRYEPMMSADEAAARLARIEAATERAVAAVEGRP